MRIKKCRRPSHFDFLTTQLRNSGRRLGCDLWLNSRRSFTFTKLRVEFSDRSHGAQCNGDYSHPCNYWIEKEESKIIENHNFRSNPANFCNSEQYGQYPRPSFLDPKAVREYQWKEPVDSKQKDSDHSKVVNEWHTIRKMR